jgi:hypothetical protein
MKNLKYYPNHITSSITYINIGICYTDGKINFIVYNQNLCDELINDIQNKIREINMLFIRRYLSLFLISIFTTTP